MAASLILLPAIFSYLIVLSQSSSSSSSSSIAQIGTETSCTNQHNHHLICDFEDAKLKIARLEAILEETTQNINAKSLYLEESRKLVDEMTHEMDRLQSALSSLKGESSRTNERLNQLEEEIRLLWATLRKTNFELHFLESKAQDAENRLELASSKVETKFMEMLDSFLFDKESAFGSYLSQVMHQLEKILSATKKYHHELQGFVKQEMEKNEFTAALAHKEVVFFVASALITFPIMSAWMLLSSQFS
ncbi:hypothetical protein ACSBR2_014596 [Camellia fascicularis]